MASSQTASHHYRQLENGRGRLGQGMIEYALILALVAVLTAGTLTVLGPTIGDVFSDVVQRLQGETVATAEIQPENKLLVSVVDSGGQGMADISVTAFTAGGSYLGQTATTSADGEASFTDLPEGGYKFRVMLYNQSYWSTPIVYPEQWRAVVETGMRDVTVTAVDANGQGVPGALIHMFTEERRYVRYGAKSDDLGQVQFQMPAGRFTFRANYRAQTYWSDVVDTAVTPTATIHTGEETFTVRVVDAQGTPVTNYAHVVVFSESGSYAGISTGTKSGELALTLPDGRYKMRVHYRSATYWSDVADTTQRDEIVVTTGERAITVRAVDAAGQGVAGVPIYAYTGDGSKYLSLRGTSDAEGRVSFQLPDGRYTFRADYRAHRYWSGAIESPAETDAAVALGERPFTVTVVDGQGRGMSDVRLFAYNAAGDYAQLDGRTNQQGQVQWLLPDGRFLFRADYRGQRYDSDVVATPDSNSATITIDQQSVTVRVVTAQGNGLANVAVDVYSVDGGNALARATTDSSGRAEFVLSGGSYRFRTFLDQTVLWSEDVTLPTSSEVVLATGQRRMIVMVTDTDGRGLKDVLVYAKTADGSFVASTHSNGAGRAVFELVAGSFIFEADVQYVRFRSGVVDTGAEDTAVITVRQTAVTFTVIDGDGDPLRRAWLGVYDTEGHFLGLQGRTDNRGQITFDLVPNTVHVKVVINDEGFWFRNLAVPGNGRITLEVAGDD